MADEWKVYIQTPRPNDPFATTQLKVIDISYSEQSLVLDGAFLMEVRQLEMETAAAIVCPYCNTGDRPVKTTSEDWEHSYKPKNLNCHANDIRKQFAVNSQWVLLPDALKSISHSARRHQMMEDAALLEQLAERQQTYALKCALLGAARFLQRIFKERRGE